MEIEKKIIAGSLEDLVQDIENLDEITLRDTVQFMNSDDYKARFVGEYLQLRIRYNGLRKMLIKLEAGTLEFTPTCDSTILENQAYYMENYLRALEVRAIIFPTAAVATKQKEVLAALNPNDTFTVKQIVLQDVQ